MEVWKSIEGYEYYEVSNLGRVKSFKRKNVSFLKPVKDTSGYLCVGLHKDFKRSLKRVHQLVAECFLNHYPNGYKLVVDHIDNDKLNNDLTNIQVITHRENISKNPPNHKNKTSSKTGVYFNKRAKKFRASIKINGKSKHLGYFTNEEEAAEAYQIALKGL